MNNFLKNPSFITTISTFLFFCFIWGSVHLVSDRDYVLKQTVRTQPTITTSLSPQKTVATHLDTNSFVRFEQTFVDSITKKETVMGVGSAVVIKTTESGSYILTNDHVCTISARTILNMSLSGKFGSMKNVVRALNGETAQVKILKKDPDDDMCVVFAQGFWRPEVKLAGKAPERGEEVFVVGSPKGYYSHKFSMVPILRGIFNGYDQNWHSSKDIMSVYSIRIAPGNSGSAVFNKKGQLIGVVHSHLTAFDEITFGTTYSDTKSFIDIYLNLK